MNKTLVILFSSLFFINQLLFSVFDIKYPENISNISTKKQLSVLLHATCKDMSFYLNGQKIIMETQDAEQRHKEYLYAQLLKPGLYLLTIKDQDETKSIGFNVTD